MSRVFARKRMINESLKDSWMIHGIQYFATENLIYIPIYNKFTTESGLLSVKLKECHPWRPPDVFFNGKDVITYYGELSNKLSLFEDFEKIGSFLKNILGMQRNNSRLTLFQCPTYL